jgi:hypothetical protein
MYFYEPHVDALELKGPVTLTNQLVNAWITHNILLCVLVRLDNWLFSMIYAMKNHWWIAQKVRKYRAQITNKQHTPAHRHTKAPNRANTFHGKSRMLCAISLMTCIWIAHRSLSRMFVRDTYLGVTDAKHPSCKRHRSAYRQWKVADESNSGNISAYDHWYPTQISRIFCVRTT